MAVRTSTDKAGAVDIAVLRSVPGLSLTRTGAEGQESHASGPAPASAVLSQPDAFAAWLCGLAAACLDHGCTREPIERLHAVRSRSQPDVQVLCDEIIALLSSANALDEARSISVKILCLRDQVSECIS